MDAQVSNVRQDTHETNTRGAVALPLWSVRHERQFAEKGAT